MKNFIFLFFIVLLCRPLNAKDFFTDELKSKRVHLILEGTAGGDFYKSPLSPLYKTDQWAFAGTGILGYKFKDNIFAGLGAGLRHCQKDHNTSFPIAGSFPAFAFARYSFVEAWHSPYVEGRMGAVVYPKWNDNIKFHSAIGGGIHILPRLTAGGQVGWYGTLDNRYTFELLFSIGFIL